ncbi:MAG: cytochrome c biogenesis protein CcsA [Nitrospirae bacterium]|nr:cytochrome c biogenesis protein CcsA [Nitrospirota bacterium]
MSRPLTLLAYLLLFAGTYLAFVEAPREAYQQEFYRLIYFHVPSAWMMMLTYAGLAFFSAMSLWKKRERWDHLAVCSAEAGTVFTAITLFTGAIWGKPVWGVWWTWDARLTTTLILLFIYAGYLLLRAFAADPARRARFAAIYALIGFFDLPLIHFSVQWWRTLHQGPSFGPGTGGLVGEPIRIIVILNFHAFVLLYASWMWRRYRTLAPVTHMEAPKVES